jgi:carboxymethylenebutenolidase
VVNRTHTNNNRKKNNYNKTKRNKNKEYSSLGAVFDKHIKYEFQDHDIDATMKTMVKEPCVHHVPMLTGGIGYDGVYNFYKNHFVGKMPDDNKVERISHTVGKDQVVDELILKFTYDREIEYLIPGILPTGKYVELPHVVVMKFRGSKIAHEHIYWDQASLLAQIGILDTSNNLPVKGIEQSRKLQELVAGS